MTKTPVKPGGAWAPNVRTTVIDMLVLGVCAWLSLHAYWQTGRPIEADFRLDVYRAFTLDQAWQARQLYPRLGMDLNFGYGGPLIQYYPPLGTYLTMGLHWLGLGWVEATKAAFTAALLLAGVGMYIYAGWLFRDRRGALVGGLGYLLAPYLLFCAYERGALAELLALSLLPWLFWAMHHVLREEGRAWIWPSAALFAGVMLAHNITALFVAPLLALYLLGMAWIERRANRLVPAAAGALGLGLSAFYWLPALGERSYAQIERWMLRGDAIAADNLVGLPGLVQRTLAFDYWSSWIPALPVVTAILAGVGLVGALVGDRGHRARVLLLAALTAIPLFLMWSASRPLYEAVSLLSYIQYPWRLLGLASFFAVTLAASIFEWRGLQGAAGWVAAAALGALIFYGAVHGIQPPTDKWFQDFTSEQISVRDHYARGKTGYWWLNNDYQSAWMTRDIAEMAWPDTPGADLGLPPIAGSPAVTVTAEGPALLRFQTASDAAFTLRAPRIFFPGWRMRVDGKLVAPAPGGPWGLVSAEIPAGNHEVTARFGETPLRAAADVISVISVLIWLVGLAYERRMKPLLAGAFVAVGLIAVVSLARYGPGRAARKPVAFPAQLEGGIQMLGYDLPARTARPGEALDLRLYWMARQTPADNYRVFLHLVTPDDTARVAQSDEAPQLDSRPTGRWLPGEVVVDNQQLLIPEDTPPGTYRLLAGMYQPEEVRNLIVNSAPAVWPGDRLDLGEIVVSGK